MKSAAFPSIRGDGFRYALDPVFLAALAIYVINRAVIKPHLHRYSPFFHGHLDDSLLVPVALPIFLLVYRLLGLRPDDAPPPPATIVADAPLPAPSREAVVDEADSPAPSPTPSLPPRRGWWSKG